jgi:hypothetical protein
MTTEHNNDNNEDYSLVTSNVNVSDNTSDKVLFVVFKTLESVALVP